MSLTPEVQEVILDLEGLARALNCSKGFLRHHWRELPHVFIGRGRDARGARFNLAEVWEYLKAKKGVNYEYLQGQEKGLVGKRFLVSQAPLPQSRISKPKRCASLGGSQARGGGGAKDPDPFHLLPGNGD